MLLTNRIIILIGSSRVFRRLFGISGVASELRLESLYRKFDVVFSDYVLYEVMRVYRAL
mgnify:CR=1 FL=1